MLQFLLLLYRLWRYRTKQSLFRYIRLHTSFTAKEQKKIRDAYDLMEYVFRDVTRESGEPYMTHLHAVTVIIVIHLKSRDIHEVIAALFHDVIEHFGDYWTYTRLEHYHCTTLAVYVLHLTKLSAIYFASEDECDIIYHSSFKTAEFAVVRVKIADRIHNTLTLHFCPISKQLRKIAETIEFYLRLAKDRGVLYPELRHAIRFARILAFVTRA